LNKETKNKPTLWLVNQFAGTPESGWGERHFYLTQPWIKQGYRVVIISSGKNHMFNQKVKLHGLFTHQNYAGVDFVWTWTPSYNPKNFTRFVPMLFFALAVAFLPFFKKKLPKPQVVMLSSMSIFPLPSVLFLKWFCKAQKFIFEVRDLWPLTPILLLGMSRNNPVIRLIGYLEKLGYRKADEVICLFEEAKKHVKKIVPEAQNIHWLPNGLSNDFLDDQSDALPFDIVRQIPKDNFVICYTGTFGFANAFEPIIELIEQDKPELKKVFFLFAGDGYLKDNYQKRTEHFPNVSFTGKLPKAAMSKIIALADVCFISWHQSELYEYGVSANKYFDYYGGKKPILAAQSNIPDPVFNSGGGIIVPNNAKSILGAILKLKALPKAELEEMGQKGFDYVKDNHLYKNLSEKLKTIAFHR
jgi:glycosyltransferase involved in cell wall biosynthesis